VKTARHVVLTLPRILARPRYELAADGRGLYFREAVVGRTGLEESDAETQSLWMNAAYSMGVRLANAFTQWGEIEMTRGNRIGEQADGLDDRGQHADGRHADHVVEVSLSSRHEAELSSIGLCPLALRTVRDADIMGTVFPLCRSAWFPPHFDSTEDNVTVEITSRLPFLIAASRFIHYAFAILQRMHGPRNHEACEELLNRWLANYVCACSGPEKWPPSFQSRYPLFSARMMVVQTPEQTTNINAYLQPATIEALHSSPGVTARCNVHVDFS
jgi:type VI secretion system protein ImpC